jgi:S-DNA-T family DNA segregation ATPase FtsK/SpoIIIE
MKAKEKAKSKEKPKRSLPAEIAGVAFLFLAVLILLSLASYSPRDPSWASASPPATPVHNYIGRVGASVAEALLQSLGAVALLLPFALIGLGLRALRREGRRWFFLRLGGFALLLLILAPLASILLQRVPWRGAVFPAGGLLGDLIAELLHRYLNTVGSVAFLAAALLLFLLFSTRWSLARSVHFGRRAFQSAIKDVRIQVTRRRQVKAKEKMRRKVVDKYTAPEPPPPEVAEKERARQAKETEKARRRAEKEAEREARREEKAARKKVPAAASKPVAPPPPEKLLFPDLGRQGDYHFPPFSLLDPGKPSEQIDKSELHEKKELIEEKLKEFGIEGTVREYHPGPVITTYEYYPAPGVKVSQVANLTEDLSLALKAESVRIQRIPGRASLGIEIPNNKREVIKVRDILQSEKFLNSPSKLTFALGKDVHGEVYTTDLGRMPHLLIAGSTGTGKSVALNALIASLLYKATPEEVKIILIDPKRLEFTLYDGIPHLLAPVINDPKKAGFVLMDTVKKLSLIHI